MEFELVELGANTSANLSSIGFLREEIDSYYTEMAKFDSFEILEIFKRLAAYTARMSGVRSQIIRSPKREAVSFRTQEIDPFLEECDRQFKIWSRAHTVMTFEWEMTSK